jgi:hypothetical protein
MEMDEKQLEKLLVEAAKDLDHAKFTALAQVISEMSYIRTLSLIFLTPPVVASTFVAIGIEAGKRIAQIESLESMFKEP